MYTRDCGPKTAAGSSIAHFVQRQAAPEALKLPPGTSGKSKSPRAEERGPSGGRLDDGEEVRLVHAEEMREEGLLSENLGAPPTAGKKEARHQGTLIRMPLAAQGTHGWCAALKSASAGGTAARCAGSASPPARGRSRAAAPTRRP